MEGRDRLRREVADKRPLPLVPQARGRSPESAGLQFARNTVGAMA